MSNPDLHVSMNIEPYKSRVTQIEKEIREGSDLWLMEIGELGVQIMRQEAPERTGELKSSISADVTGATIQVSPTVPYAVYVELGTRPHVIHGRPLLSWIDENGTRVFTTKVQHPGTTANPFMARSKERLQAELRDMLIKKLKVIIEK